MTSEPNKTWTPYRLGDKLLSWGVFTIEPLAIVFNRALSDDECRQIESLLCGDATDEPISVPRQ